MSTFNKNEFYFKILEPSFDNQWSILKIDSTDCGHSFFLKYQIKLLSKNFVQWAEISNKFVELSWNYKNINNYTRGFISKFSILEKLNGLFAYTVSLRSLFFPLSLNQSNRVFTNKTAKQIITIILKKYTFLNYRLNFKSTAQISFKMQHNQTDFSFISQLIKEHRLFCYWNFTKNKTNLIITDQLKKTSTIHLKFSNQTDISNDCVIAFDCQQKYQNLTNSWTTKDYNPETPLINLHGKSINNTKIAGNGNRCVYGLGEKTSMECKKNSELLSDCIDLQRETTCLKTNHKGLTIENIIYLSNHPLEKINGAYQILTISHHIDQNAKHIRYFNKITLVPVGRNLAFMIKDYLNPYKKVKKQITILAKIVGQNEYPFIDTEGNYSIQFYCDMNKNNCTTQFRKLQLYGGKTNKFPYGIHFPLKKNTIIIIGFENSDCDRPIILGTLNNPLAVDLITNNRFKQNRIRTTEGNEIIFDDYGKIELHTKNEEQKLQLSKKKKSKGINCIAKKGEILIKSSHSLQLTCNKNKIIKIKKSNFVRSKIYQGLTKKSDIQINSSKNMKIKTMRTKVKAYKSIYANTKGHFVIKSNKIEINNSGNCEIKTCGKIHIKTKKAILCGGFKINLNKLIVINKNSINFTNATLDAAIILMNDN